MSGREEIDENNLRKLQIGPPPRVVVVQCMLNAAHRTDGWTVHSGNFEPNYFHISKSYIEYSNIHAAPRPRGGRSLKMEQKFIKFEQIKPAKFWRFFF